MRLVSADCVRPDEVRPLTMKETNMTHIFVDRNTGELRGTRPRGYLKLTPLIAFAGLIGAAAIAISPLPFMPSFQTEATGGRDAIPFRNINGGMFVYANLGGVPHNMQLDTGASSSTVTVPIARVLIARRQAYVDGWVNVTTADGSTSPHPIIVVYTVGIGRHRLHNVRMSVMPDGADLLLGLSELSAIGSFTVDQAHNQIRFN
jgi:gag-polyprotein putative aspartyl protease